MSIYVISDIHGHYEDFKQMLQEIEFSYQDELILAGDYVDRGPQTVEMLRWIENCPDNVIPLKGNHDAEFDGYVRLLQIIDGSNELMTDPYSAEDTQILFETLIYVLKLKGLEEAVYFDYYGTIEDLVINKGITFGELIRWADMLEGLAYYKRFELGGRECVVVHAGFCEEDALHRSPYDRLEDFCIYAREEGLNIGGIRNGLIIAGHTPTIVEDSIFFNEGKVFRQYDEEKDCIFYNIDCGCGFKGRGISESCRLACIRLEDEEVFYV